MESRKRIWLRKLVTAMCHPKLYLDTRPLQRGTEVDTVRIIVMARRGGTPQWRPTVPAISKDGKVDRSTAREGLETLKAATYHLLGVIRVDTKVPGGPADRTNPITLPINSTALDLARDTRGYVRWERL
jgi:hypothetical protein